MHEHVATPAPATTAGQVVRQRAADINRQRQPPMAALAADDQLSGAPVDVLQSHGGNLARAQPQPHQHGQDRVVAPADRGAPIAACQQPAQLRRGERR